MNLAHVLLTNSSSAISYFLSKIASKFQTSENILHHVVCALWLGHLHRDRNFEESITLNFSDILKNHRNSEKHFDSNFFEQRFLNDLSVDMDVVSVFDHVIRLKKTVAILNKCEGTDEEIEKWEQIFSEFFNMQLLFMTLKIVFHAEVEKNIFQNHGERSKQENKKFSVQFDSPMLYYIHVKKGSGKWEDVFMRNNQRYRSSRDENLKSMSKYIRFLRSVMEEVWERAIYPRESTETISPAESGDFLKIHDLILEETDRMFTCVKEPYFQKKKYVETKNMGRYEKKCL